MSTYFAPGVYIEEVPSGPQPIAPASTSVVAIIGSTRRGPVGVATRLSGWTDFQRIFDGNAGDGFTAEAVYGFFENDGPAAFVVRADPSIAGTWTVKAADGTDSFVVTASSPGSWASDHVVSAAPDRTSGSAQLYRASVTAAVTLSGPVWVAVDSTGGVTSGDRVQFLQIGTAAPIQANVLDVGVGQIRVQRTAGGTPPNLAPGIVVTGVIQAADTQLGLIGSGIKGADVLQAETGDRSRVSWRATSVVSHGTGLTVAAAAAGGTAVPGAQYTQRVEQFRGTLSAPSSADVPLSAVTWSETDGLEPGNGDLTTNLHAWASDGTEATWVAGTTNVLRFPAVPPSGPISVEALLSVDVFSEARTWTNPTLQQLNSAYSFIPVGTQLSLAPAAGPAITLTQGAAGFAVDGGATLTGTFVSAGLVPNQASDGLVVRCPRPPEVGDVVRFTDPNQFAITAVQPVGGDVYSLSFTQTDSVATSAGASLALMRFVTTRFYPLRFQLSVSGSAGSETYSSLALDPAHPQYFARDGVINEVSQLVTVTSRAPAAGDPSPDTTPAFAVAGNRGTDVPPAPQDYIKAVSALDIEPEPAMVACPDLIGFGDELAQYAMVDAMVRHCENFRRFAVLDAPRGDDTKVMTWRNTAVASTYAAVFAPYVQILSLDPSSTDKYRFVPPSGFVAGVMARTDRDRGVHKAPGNEQVSGIVGLDQQYTQARQEALNPAAVNLIRTFPGRGSRVWGARNATDDVTWRYINVRRLFNFVEVSVDRGTQWVVFEPNVATTWLRVKASVEGFLDQLWRSGGLAGDTAAMAYRVRIGLGQTMTETDIDNGLIITEVAIAPAKPAEFVVFRFSHKRLSE